MGNDGICCLALLEINRCHQIIGSDNIIRRGIQADRTFKFPGRTIAVSLESDVRTPGQGILSKHGHLRLLAGKSGEQCINGRID
jgi:hypothetical protein